MMSRYSIMRNKYIFGPRDFLSRPKRKVEDTLQHPIIPTTLPIHNGNDDDEDDPLQPFKFTKLFNPQETDVYTEQNHIYFKTDVTEESINKLSHAVNELNLKLKKMCSNDNYGVFSPKPIILHITTCGGDLLSGFFGYDIVKNSKVPIHTVIEGSVASAGSLLSIAGEKRYITEHSHILIHQLRTGMIGTYEDLKEEKLNCNHFMNKLINLYYQNCNNKMSKKEIREVLKRDIFWDSKKAIKQGVVDEIWFN